MDIILVIVQSVKEFFYKIIHSIALKYDIIALESDSIALESDSITLEYDGIVLKYHNIAYNIIVFIWHNIP